MRGQVRPRSPTRDRARASPLNQAFFEALYVDVDDVAYRRLAEPFAHLLDQDVLARLEREKKDPAPVLQDQGDANKSVLVEVMRLLLNPSFGKQLRELTDSD